MNIKEQIKAEIERHLNSAIEHQNANPYMPKYRWYLYEGAKELCTDLLYYLDDTLPEQPASEPSEDLEKEISGMYQALFGTDIINRKEMVYLDTFTLIARHFAEWQKEQMPAWSEEDEEMLEYIMDDVNDATQLYATKEAKVMADKEIAWLKSLRPYKK